LLQPGPPYNIVGQSLAVTPGTAISGGTVLAGDYIRYEAKGSGHIFAFGDRSDHNYFNPGTGNVHGQLFLNIVNYAGGQAPGPDGVIPEPATVSLVGGAVLVLLALRRKLKSS